MNLFEIILVVLLGVYVLSNLYFSISGRILAIKGRKEDLERRNKDEEYENQLNILTKHVDEVVTENHNLTMNLQEYQVAYAQVKAENEELKKKLEEPKKTTEVMGWWNKPGDKNFRFRFQPRFLTNAVDRDNLVVFQLKQLMKIKKEEGE